MQPIDILNLPNQPKEETPIDTSIRLTMISTVEAFERTLYQGLLVLDIRCGKILHVSANPTVLTPADREALLSEGVRTLIDKVPESERHFVSSISMAVCKMFAGKPSLENMVVSTNFYLQLGERPTMLNVKVTPLVCTDEGEVSVVLCVLSPSVHGKVGNMVARTHGDSHYYIYNASKGLWEEHDALMLLTPDERTMLYLSAQGLTLKAIADQMHRAIDTVKGYRRQIFSKLGVSNISEALSFAATYHLL